MHSFECSCADYSTRGVLYSHIHTVNIRYPKTIAVDLELRGTELEATSDNDIEKKRDDLSNLIQQDKKLQHSKQLLTSKHMHLIRSLN